MKPRIVVDTNVLIGALLAANDSANRAVLRRCLQESVRPIVGVALFHEYEDLLSRDTLDRSPLSRIEREELFAAFLSVCEWVRVFFLWRPNLTDEGDNHLIELAVAGGANFIITQNTSDLRSGELRFPGIRVVTPAEFLNSN
jgi:putative PIN family toxin of toxin-antitoxin system